MQWSLHLLWIRWKWSNWLFHKKESKMQKRCSLQSLCHPNQLIQLLVRLKLCTLHWISLLLIKIIPPTQWFYFIYVRYSLYASWWCRLLLTFEQANKALTFSSNSCSPWKSPWQQWYSYSYNYFTYTWIARSTNLVLSQEEVRKLISSSLKRATNF